MIELKDQTRVNELPSKKYNLIYADPPWQYHNWADNAHGAAISHYHTMPTDLICKLPIPAICQDDCLLFLWATMPKLVDALKVVQAWGFEHKTGMVWVKDHPTIGFWFMGQAELLLLATKGTVPVFKTKKSNVLKIGATIHSKKPDTFRRMVEQIGGGHKVQ